MIHEPKTGELADIVSPTKTEARYLELELGYISWDCAIIISNSHQVKYSVENLTISPVLRYGKGKDIPQISQLFWGFPNSSHSYIINLYSITIPTTILTIS